MRSSCKLIGLLIHVFLASASKWDRPCSPVVYNISSSRAPDKLNVHIVPHTHDDSGWLKTVDQYYYGARNDIQLAAVQYILDTVIQALKAEPQRRFTYAEMSFFTRWWRQQVNATKDVVRDLVAKGQLDFVNGGWVQHDEAAAHYVAMIDQTTRGHQFLKETFGVLPTIGWQLDPFGHSSTNAALMTGALGFDATFFGRADYQDMQIRKSKKQMEMVWRGAESYGKDADVLACNFPSGNYGAPNGFWFDPWAQDPPLMDDECMFDYNIQERVDLFVEGCKEISNVTYGNDILIPFGSDFQWVSAQQYYKNVDKLIHYLNLDGRVNAFYSSPADYIAVKNSYDHDWPLKEDDFFPYADCPTCYWTGYFTSRPTSKGWIRSSTSYLNAARQLESLTGLRANGPNTDSLEAAVSLLQHHDSITGTEKQHVADDYHVRLDRGLAETQQLVSEALMQVLHTAAAPSKTAGGANVTQTNLISSSRHLLSDCSAVQAADTVSTAEVTGGSPGLQQCRLLNASICEASISLSGQGEAFQVVLYNPLAWERPTEPIRVPVGAGAEDAGWTVTGPDGKEVISQLLPVSNATRELQATMLKTNLTASADVAASAELAFIASVPPVGLATYTVARSRSRSRSLQAAQPSTVHFVSPSESADRPGLKADSSNITNDIVTLSFGQSTGLITQLVNKQASRSVDLGIDFVTYLAGEAGLNGTTGPPSGAYIFKPNGTEGTPGPLSFTVVEGPVVSEVHQHWTNYTSLTARIWKDALHVEFEWTVGPIPFRDGRGREVSLRFQSSLDSGSTFYTDANGREYLRRKIDWRPTWKLNVTEPIAGNYYPITAGIYLRDERSTELAVLTERAQSAASLGSGEVEVMVHRRTLLDDWRGVGEPINETMCGCRECSCTGLVARGSHWLTLQDDATAAQVRRTLQQRLNDPLLVAFGPASSAAGDALQQLRHSSVAQALPLNVHLLTLKALEDGSTLLRLAHLYQIHEDPKLSQPATVDIAELLSNVLVIGSIEEQSLSANQPRANVKRKQWRTGAPLGPEGSIQKPAELLGGLSKPAEALTCRSSRDCKEADTMVTLGPLEIRTFVLQTTPSTA